MTLGDSFDRAVIKRTERSVASINSFSRELRVSVIDWRNTGRFRCSPIVISTNCGGERRIINAVACRLLAPGIICFRPASIKQSVRHRRHQQQQGKSSLYIYSSAQSTVFVQLRFVVFSTALYLTGPSDMCVCIVSSKSLLYRHLMNSNLFKPSTLFG